MTSERQQREMVSQALPSLFHASEMLQIIGSTSKKEVQCSRALLQPMELFPFTAAKGLALVFLLQKYMQSKFQIFIMKMWTGFRLDVLPGDGPKV